MKKVSIIFYFNCLVPFVMLSQNIGIGTVTPTRAKLELNGAVGSTSAIFGGEGTGISLQRNWPTVGFNQYYNAGSKYIGNGFAAAQFLDPNNGYLIFDMYPSGSTDGNIPTYTRPLLLTSTGKVGIGGVVPHGSLQLMNEINNRRIVLWETADNDHQYYGFGIESGTLRYAVPGQGEAHRFYCGLSSTSSRLLAELSGSNISASLRVFRGTGIDGTAVFQGSTYHSHFNYGGSEDTYIRGGINGSRVIINDIPDGFVSVGNGTGRIGINTTDPQYTLDIRQSNYGIGIGTSDYSNNWEIWSPYSLHFLFAGELKAYVSHIDGSWNDLSDIRLKTDVVPVPDIMNRLLMLKPISYHMKSEASIAKKTLGFSAQDLKSLFPELVSVISGVRTGYEDIPDLHMVNYGGLGVIAIKAIQEQQVRIENQQKQIDELRTELQLMKIALSGFSDSASPDSKN